jgi:hypothetical protein
MKAEIDKEGTLIIRAKNDLESFALESWVEKNINPCTGNFIKEPVNKCFFIDSRVPKINLFHRIKFKIQLFLYR